MTPNLFSLSSYQYNLPSELIAQHPVFPRDHSRLMIVNRQTGELSEIPFFELKHFLNANDHLIFNNTKVIPARLLGKRQPGGGITEILLHKFLQDNTWQVLIKPGKKIKLGSKIIFSNDLSCEIIDFLPEGLKVVKFYFNPVHHFNDLLNQLGSLPLPPYIKRKEHKSDSKADSKCYQTVYAKEPGAIAAPTAGLHFTDSLLESLHHKKVKCSEITLHVGMGTFKPVEVEDIRQHPMHFERCIISDNVVTKLNEKTEQNRRICIGTTCCRSLESASDEKGLIRAGEWDTNLFIYPGYKFKYVTGLLTNFHLPGSTLIMLVSAFGGYELIKEAYRKAIKEKYRFYSYGDAMLII